LLDAALFQLDLWLVDNHETALIDSLGHADSPEDPIEAVCDIQCSTMACQYFVADLSIRTVSYFDGYKSLVYVMLIVNGYNQWKWHIVHVELTVAKRSVCETRTRACGAQMQHICCDHSTHTSLSLSLLVKHK